MRNDRKKTVFCLFLSNEWRFILQLLHFHHCLNHPSWVEEYVSINSVSEDVFLGYWEKESWKQQTKVKIGIVSQFWKTFLFSLLKLLYLHCPVKYILLSMKDYSNGVENKANEWLSVTHCSGQKLVFLSFYALKYTVSYRWLIPLRKDNTEITTHSTLIIRRMGDNRYVWMTLVERLRTCKTKIAFYWLLWGSRTKRWHHWKKSNLFPNKVLLTIVYGKHTDSGYDHTKKYQRRHWWQLDKMVVLARNIMILFSQILCTWMLIQMNLASFIYG